MCILKLNLLNAYIHTYIHTYVHKSLTILTPNKSDNIQTHETEKHLRPQLHYYLSDISPSTHSMPYNDNNYPRFHVLHKTYIPKQVSQEPRIKNYYQLSYTYTIYNFSSLSVRSPGRSCAIQDTAESHLESLYLPPTPKSQFTTQRQQQQASDRILTLSLASIR